MSEDKIKILKDLLRRKAVAKTAHLHIIALVLFVVGIFLRADITIVLIVNCIGWFLLGRSSGYVKGAVGSVDILEEGANPAMTIQQQKLDKLYGRQSDKDH